MLTNEWLVKQSAEQGMLKSIATRNTTTSVIAKVTPDSVNVACASVKF